MTTTSSKSTEPKSRNTSEDAIALLTADHKTVKALFKEFEDLTKQKGASEQKARVVEQICNELTVHAQVEEELFYPAVRDAIDDDALMDKADIEHASAKEIIAQLESMEPEDDHYDARVTVLREYIDHHVKEEEGEIFAKARKADVDTLALGEQIADRKVELKSKLGIDEEDAGATPLTKPVTHSKKKESRR